MERLLMQQTVMEQSAETTSAVQTPMDGTLENGVEELTIGETPAATPSSSGQKKAPLTYDELFPALPSSGDGAGQSPSVGNGLSTTTPSSGGGWGSAARNDAMRIQSSVITQVFHVTQDERAKLGGNNHFGESASSSICTDITKKTGAHIEISSAKDHSLTFLVTGKSDAVLKARKLVLEKFQAQNRSSVMIPKEHHKFILGKKGKKLQELEINSGTKIQVPGVADQSEEISISGNKDCIENAIHEIRKISDEQSKQSSDSIDVPKMYHPFIFNGTNSHSAQLTNEYGVRINMPPPSSEKTEIIIVGEKESVAKVKAVIAKISNDMDRRAQIVCVEVPKNQHKYIVGHRGSSINEILDKHNVSVEIPSQDSDSSTITLRGPPEKLGAALTMVYDKASSMVHVDVIAPSWLHRYIIGKKGANINKVTAEFPAVHVEFTDVDDIIKLEGPREEVEKARESLETMISDMQSRLTQEQITVDSRFHKHIIGKAGSNINRIRNESNVLINIDTKGGSIIKLEGTPEGVRQVKKELEELVAKMENEKEREVAIESRLHGNIIGTKGETIREIRDRFNQVQITFPSANIKDDKVKVRGPKEDVDACCKYLSKLAKDLMENNHQIKVAIFKQVMRFVIGKGGSNINKIRAETNTKIDFKENETGSDDIIITGSKENCEKARELIEEIQKEQANITEIEIFVPAKIHNSIIGPKGRLIQSISDECGGVAIKFPNKGDKKSDKVSIRGPKEEVFKAKKILVDLSNEKQISGHTEEVRCKFQHHKFLIGKSGATIMELREQTGARIIFPNIRDEDKEVITIIGKKEQVAAAKAILEKRIKELDNITETTVNINPRHHYHFVARRGEVLRTIGDQFGGVSISFPKNGTNSEVVTIKGAVDCVAGAKTRILEIVNELESRVTIEVIIPQRHHRTVMGQRGSSIQNITSTYNVDVKFPDRPSRDMVQEEAPVLPEGEVNPQDIVVVKGLASSVEEARKALLELVPIIIEMTIPFKYHRFIIGQRGQAVRNLMQKHNVNIQVPPVADQSDTIKITGSASNTESAKADLEEQLVKLREEEEDKQARSHKVVINVASEYHPKIIGKKGSVVSKLRDQYGVNIQFAGRDDADPTLITITGYEGKCEEAKDAIFQITGDLDSMVKTSVDIDNRVHSRLIGQRGKAIRKVMDEFKVSISFPRDDENPNVVMITGPEDKVNDCKDHLLNLAEEYVMDIQEREDMNSYASTKPRSLQLGDSLAAVGGGESWAAEPENWAGQASQSWADDSAAPAVSEEVVVKPNKKQHNGRGPVANGINRQGFVVSGAPWAQEAPNVNSSTDFPSMGAASTPDVSFSWGPGRR